MNIEKLLYEASLQQGFKLEFQTYSKLTETFGFKHATYSLNYDLQSNDYSHLVDVYYRKCHTLNDGQYVTTNYLIECKGSRSNNQLLLIDQTQKFYDQLLKYNAPVLHGTDLQPIDLNKSLGPRMAYTGDFFLAGKSDSFTKAPIQDIRNNLYKGISQLKQAIPALLAHRQMDRHFGETTEIIVPLIVTNVDIHVIDYEDETITKVPWALYSNPIDTRLDNQQRMTHVIITNLDNLADLLKKTITRDLNRLNYSDEWRSDNQPYKYKS